MAGKTDRTQLQFLYKKTLGFANTSNVFTENEETIPSTNQLSAQTIFGEDIPRAVNRVLNTVQSATAEYVLLTASVLPGTTYDANDAGGGGDGAQSPGPHAYSLQMASNYQASTDNSKAGSFPFTDGQTIYETSGSLQLIGPGFSGNSPNPYLLKLYENDGSGGIGNEISLTDEIDWLVDYYNGVLFVQDYDSGQIPAFAKAFIYTGDMLSASLGGGGSGPGDANATYVVMSATGSLNAERVLTNGLGINLTDGGAGGNATLAVDNSVVATISGSQFSGNVGITSQLSVTGSLFASGDSLFGSSPTSTHILTGSTTMSGTVYVSGTLNMSGSIIPDADGVYDLGSPSRQWAELYLSGSSLHIGGQTITAGTNSISYGAGDSTKKFIVGEIALSGSMVTSDAGDNLRLVGPSFIGGSTSANVLIQTTRAQVTGTLDVSGGLSGSLTRLANGSSYLIAGSNVTITSQSNGAVTITSSGGGGSGDVTNASNLGSGEGIFAQKSGTVLDFKSLVVSSGLSISSNTTSITLSTNFDTLARQKSNYEVTQSHAANATLIMPGVDYSTAAYDSNLIDVFLNGQLLLSGTAPQAAAGAVDYSVVASGSLKVGFSLEADDNVSSIIINNGAATGATSMILNESPTGLINGINDSFTLTNTPSPSTSLMLFINGQLITQTTDYTLATNTITFDTSAVPMIGDILLATYQH